MKPPITHQWGNAVVTIQFADITNEERQRRIEHEIKPALAQFGRSALAAGIELNNEDKKQNGKGTERFKKFAEKNGPAG